MNHRESMAIILPKRGNRFSCSLGEKAGMRADFLSLPAPSSGSRVEVRASAFTLIELMVVITIIGIMTALMIPEMKGSFQDALLRANSRELINAFDLAYSRAVSLNQVRRVRLDASTGRYLVERQALDDGQESFVPADDVPGSKGQLDSRITVEFHPTKEDSSAETTSSEPPVAASESGPDTVTFYPDGTADAGAVLLRDRAGFRLLLQIDPVTARVHVVEMEREAQP